MPTDSYPSPASSPSHALDEGKNAQFKSSRREVKHARIRRNATGSVRGTRRSVRSDNRRLVVHAELREKPDVAKLARAVIQMALAEAEAEAARDAASSAASESPSDNGTPAINTSATEAGRV